MPDFYELVEHTADICIRVNGKSLPELFCNAARALFDIIAGPCGRGTSASMPLEVRVKAQSRDELLVNWLNELLFLSAVKELILTDFRIDEASDCFLKAFVSGIPAASCRMTTEVKAATYHGLAIEESSGVFRAQIIFDV